MTDRLISLNAAIEAYMRRRMGGSEEVIEALRALPDASDMQMMNDLVNYGVHVTSDGERVDPMDFYAEPPK